ncbi:MAG: hypothetical protein JRF02_07365 [Deltaproteobacteria bacterium]|nr:hypothetical protein [Deltaproteobacteria bacterium]
MAAFLSLIISLIPFTARTEVDWEVSGAVQLAETPIDVARAQTGDLAFILTDKAEVLIYSIDGKQVGTVQVEPSVTDIAISSKGDQLLLIDSKRKTLKTVDIHLIVEFNLDGSPFLGPSDAGIVVAVFSDFQ